MKFDFQKILSGHSLALVVILVTSILGLIVKPNEKHIPPYKWALLITGTMSATGLLCLFGEHSVNQILEDNKPDSHSGNPEDDRGSRSGDVHVHTHVVWPALFDEKLEIVAKDVEEIAQRVRALNKVLAKQATARANAEAASIHQREQEARDNLIAMLSDLGTEGGVLTPLFEATQICMDTRLWHEPAKYATRYQDTERFCGEEKIWPVIQNNRIEWGSSPDLEQNNEPESDPLFSTEDVEPISTEDVEPSIKQTPFRPFHCCSQCKYIGEYQSSCAVVPLGCGTGDRSEKCREFEGKNGGTEVVELILDDVPF